jgi:hypothetical protein
MDEQNEGAQPQDDEVEAHLLKESAAAAAAAGVLFAGASSAQARVVDPETGEAAQAALTQHASTAPAKKTAKKADTHQRQHNRADTIDP